MKYNWASKNSGKDLILVNRLAIAKSMGIKLSKCKPKMYSYLMEAELEFLLI